MSLAAESALPPLVAERPEDAVAVDRLVLRAFGPGRYAKAAERLREGRTPVYELSFLAWDGAQVAGCVQMWRVRIGGRPALLLGPFAVEPTLRSQGLGAALVARACEAAEAAGWDLVVLVGDAPYFAPLGFTLPAGRLTLPGPADRRRVLVRALKPGADEGLEGAVVSA
jgi:predicted N-acetyltransferase YhbS